MYEENLTDEECLDIIEPEVIRQLEELGFTWIDETGEREYAFGAAPVKWGIQKELMREKFGRDWVSPQDRYPGIIFD